MRFRGPRPPQNVFVLSTGRCGSMTFTRACEHLTNFTSGHETRAAELGAARFAYPPAHIEADNRLTWFLGGLAARFDDRDVLYVHLRRDPEAVARSFLARWDSPYRASIIRAFAHGLTTRKRDWEDPERVCRAYVETVTANLEEFLRTRPHLDVWLETVDADFPPFLDRIAAEGDLDAAIAEWTTAHNASAST